jgi:hypothetical protein
MKSRQSVIVSVIWILSSVVWEVDAFVATASLGRASLLIQREVHSTTQLSMWSQNDDIEGADKIKACIPYVLPLIDGDHFGTYIYQRIPALGLVDDVLLQPLVNFAHAIPFSSVLLYLALVLGTRNERFSRGVKFNAQQAALIDVALVIPEVIAGSMEGSDIPRYIMEPCSNFTYYAYMSMIVYCLVSNLRGRKPNEIPFISETAERAVGPF